MIDDDNKERNMSKLISGLAIATGFAVKYSNVAIRALTHSATLGLPQNLPFYLGSYIFIERNILERLLIEPLGFYLTGAGIRRNWGNSWKDYLVNSFIGFGVHSGIKAGVRFLSETTNYLSYIWPHNDIPIADPYTVIPFSAVMAVAGSLIPYAVKKIKNRNSTKE